MTVRYPCPLPPCQWFHDHVVTPLTADVPTDILLWTPLNWADMNERTGPGLTAAQKIDAHLATHSPVQWMAELNRERQLRQAAEAERDRALWMPSRAEVEAEATDLWRPAVAVRMGGGTVNGGGADV